MKKINIGLIGFGTVGQGVYEVLQKNNSLIKKRKGVSLKIKKICDLKVGAVKKMAPKIEVVKNWESLVNDPGIDLIVELIGGIKPAKDIILKSLKQGKGVVTANKKLLAEKGEDIFRIAGESKSFLGFEAAIGGGMPCLLALESGLVGNEIRLITGILNGTTNYILTQMENNPQASFTDVLREAQIKGFAELDPTFDIEGFDAGHKIALLAMLAYNSKIDFKSLSIEGITKINQLDIINAKEMGYKIKLLGIAKIIDGKLDLRVHPTMIPGKHPLAAVHNEFNAIMFEGDMTDPILIYGKGAGSHPTASAVVSDLVQMARPGGADLIRMPIKKKISLLPSKDRFSKYYLRIHTEDSPGILAKIAAVLGRYGISIASVLQKQSPQKYVPIIIMTHQAAESKILTAIDKIKKLSFVDKEIIFIRVEDF